MKSNQATCASAIKAELKAAFPSIKFSVKSEIFAGGDAVRISYEDGVSTSKIEAIVKKYQYGHFNGMEDIYENSNVNKFLPQVKFVPVSRKMSTDTKLQIMGEIGISVENYTDYNNEKGEYNSALVYREFVKREFGIEPTVENTETQPVETNEWLEQKELHDKAAKILVIMGYEATVAHIAKGLQYWRVDVNAKFQKCLELENDLQKLLGNKNLVILGEL